MAHSDCMEVCSLLSAILVVCATVYRTGMELCCLVLKLGYGEELYYIDDYFCALHKKMSVAESLSADL